MMQEKLYKDFSLCKSLKIILENEVISIKTERERETKKERERETLVV